jgi:serine/threonine protein kinase
MYKENQLRQLVSEFGGKSFASLSGLNLRPGTFDFFRFMRHTLEGCALLALNNVVHYDLHRSNILVDALRVPRLIDFGMSFDSTNIDTTVLKNRWKEYDPKYDSEPPEITVITGIRKGMNLQAVAKDAVYGKPVFKVYELIFGISREDVVKDLMAFLKDSKSFEKGDWVLFFQIYWPGFDSFALGAVLLHVLQTQLTWPSFVESEQWKNHGEITFKVLKEMLNVNPSERYDCVEALALMFPDSVVLKNSDSWLAARKIQRQG